jgi:aryl-alcohol dehydrogenase-like predicted oxidoreductase
MEYRRLGRSGLNISKLVLGTMNFGRPTDKTESFKIVDAAIDAGINTIDCADVYVEGESERILGEALKRNRKRRNIILTTKVYNRMGPGPNDMGNSRFHIMDGCEQSLRRLQTDVIDIYYLHRTDFNVPQEESLAALDLLIKQGKIRYVACSTFPPWRTVEALMLAERYNYPKFVCEQPPYNLLDRRIENDYIPMCRAYDMGIMSWSPLAHGVLAGRYMDAARMPEGSRGTLRRVFGQRITDPGIEVGHAFVKEATRMGHQPSQLAVAWVLHQPGISGTIIGPRSTEQLEDLLPAADIKLQPQQLSVFDQLVPPGRHVVNYFNTSGWML